MDAREYEPQLLGVPLWEYRAAKEGFVVAYIRCRVNSHANSPLPMAGKDNAAQVLVWISVRDGIVRNRPCSSVRGIKWAKAGSVSER